jgi:hypothetical protein
MQMRSGEAGVHGRRVDLLFDVGTLWTLERDTHVARCALLWVPHAWELRVLIDDETLLSERCCSQVEVLEVASAWGTRLRAGGWSDAGSAAGELVGVVGEHCGGAEIVGKRGHLVPDGLALRGGGRPESVGRHGQADPVRALRERRIKTQ